MRVSRTGRKVGFYLCLFVLLLSLPTFSYLIPDSQKLLSSQQRTFEAERKDSVISFKRKFTGSPGFVVSPPPKPLAAASEISQVAVPDESGSMVALPSETPSYSVAFNSPSPLGIGGKGFEVWSRGSDRTFSEAAAKHEGSRPEDGLESELFDLEKSYELVFNNLFGELPFPLMAGLANPFHDALAKQTPEQKGSAGSEAPGKPAAKPPSEAGGVSALTPNPDQIEKKPAERAFGFLVLGELRGNQPGRLFRANRDESGNFVLENSFRFTLFQGARTAVLTFDQNEQLLTDDLNGDGLGDYVLTRTGPLGTVLDAYTRDLAGNYQRWAYGFIFQKKVTSFALYDFTGDGQLDLTLLVDTSPHLFVYERSGDQFKYLKELVLPFEAGLVVDSRAEGVLEERRLYVFDKKFAEVITMTPGSRGNFLIGDDAPLSYVRDFKVEPLGQGTGEIAVFAFETPSRIMLFEKGTKGATLYGGFDLTLKVPLVILGDYLGHRSRQLIYVP